MLLLECPTLPWLFTSFQELESVTSCNPDLAREDQDVMRQRNENLVRQGSSLRNWGRWGRPLQRVWCEGFLIRQWCLVPEWRLPKPYWSIHFRDVSETNGHSDHACDLKRKGRPENEGLGNYDLMDEGNDVVIIKLEVVSRKGPNSWLNRSLNILVRGSADTSIWNFLAPGLWVSDYINLILIYKKTWSISRYRRWCALTWISVWALKQEKKSNNHKNLSEFKKIGSLTACGYYLYIFIEYCSKKANLVQQRQKQLCRIARMAGQTVMSQGHVGEPWEVFFFEHGIFQWKSLPVWR